MRSKWSKKETWDTDEVGAARGWPHSQLCCNQGNQTKVNDQGYYLEA